MHACKHVRDLKDQQVLSEMAIRHLDILGKSDSHWQGSGRQVLQHDPSFSTEALKTPTHRVAPVLAEAKLVLTVKLLFGV